MRTANTTAHTDNFNYYVSFHESRENTHRVFGRAPLFWSLSYRQLVFADTISESVHRLLRLLDGNTADRK